jgi:putative addiction module killer protein
MVEVIKTSAFDAWLDDLRDIRAKAKILARIDRLSNGNPGDVAPIGDGLSEMKIDYGPGYRVYYLQHGQLLVVLLCAGEKGSQKRDIKDAKAYAAIWKEQNDG